MWREPLAFTIQCLRSLERYRAINRKHKRRNSVEYGDVVCVGEGQDKRFGIWTGQSFIQYATDSRGEYLVHEVDFHDFLRGASTIGVCRFARYCPPLDTQYLPSVLDTSFTPYDCLRFVLYWIYRRMTYHCYSPRQTICRAEKSLGRADFATSEDFALWCKVGIEKQYSFKKK